MNWKFWKREEILAEVQTIGTNPYNGSATARVIKVLDPQYKNIEGCLIQKKLRFWASLYPTCRFITDISKWKHI